MADLLTPGIHPRESEFVYDPDIKQWLNGTCGVTSCAMVEWAETLREIHTLDVYRIMRAHNLCGVNGETASTDWLAYAHLRGLPVAEFRSYSVPWPDYQAFIERHAGSATVIVETTNGQALVDMVSGKGENARNLQRHIITLWGTGVYRGVSGVWASDGDNFAVGNVLQFYSWQTIATAALCAGLAITISGGQQPMAWTKQPDGSGKDARGNVCGAGDMAYLEGQSLAGSDGLMSETYYDPTHSFLPLESGWIVTWDGKNVGEAGAQALVEVWQQLQAAKATQPPAANPAEVAKAAALDNLMALYGVK